VPRLASKGGNNGRSWEGAADPGESGTRQVRDTDKLILFIIARSTPPAPTNDELINGLDN
jgi:hypothetical protein